MRWSSIAVTAAMLSAATAAAAQEASYPTRTVAVIAPFAAGGPADITARIAADILSRRLGHTAVVENVTGGGGLIGSQRVARAAPDGYTLLAGHLGTNAVAPLLYPNPGYDPQRDFEPVSLTAEYPEVLVVRNDLPATDLASFAAFARANESRLNMGHAGVGSVSWIGCQLLNASIGIRPTLVPFTGTAPMVNAIVAGQIDYGCDPVLGPLGHIRAGTLKGLAVAAAARSPLLPDLPTSHEQDLPAFDCAPFYGLFAPRGTPKAIIDRLAAAIGDGLSEAAVVKRMTDLGATVPAPSRRGPAPLAAVVAAEIARVGPLVANAPK